MTPPKKMDNQKSQSVQIFSKYCVVAIMFIGFIGKFSIFADGSYYLWKISSSGGLMVGPVEWNRYLSYLLTQGPLALASDLGIDSMNLLLGIYSFGVLFVTCFFLVYFYSKTLNFYRVELLYIAIPIALVPAILVCLSTNFIGTALLLASISVIIRYRESSAIDKFTMLSILTFQGFTGDSVICFAPGILVLIYSRFKFGGLPKSIAIYLSVVELISVAINILSFTMRMEGVTAERASNGALRPENFVKNSQVMLALAIFIFLAVALRYSSKIKVIAFTLAVIALSINYILPIPDSHTIFNARYFHTVFLGILVFYLSVKSLNTDNSKSVEKVPTLNVLILVTFLTLSPVLKLAIQFNSYLSEVDYIVNSSEGQIGFEEARLSQNSLNFTWDYTSPSISRIFWRDSKSGLILNYYADIWQPVPLTGADPMGKNIYWK